MSTVDNIGAMTGRSMAPAYPGEGASRAATRLRLSLARRPVRAA